MKTLACILLLSLSLIVPKFAFAVGSPFPNDTQTEVLDKQGDCGVVNVVTGYFTRFSDTVSKFPRQALVLNISVRNDGYDKVIRVRSAKGDVATAVYTIDWSEFPLAAIYRNQQAGTDLFTLVDQQVGTDKYGVFSIEVTMNGETHTCSGVMIGRKRNSL